MRTAQLYYSSWPAAAACTALWWTACSPSHPETVRLCSCCTAWTACSVRTLGVALDSASASTRPRGSWRSPPPLATSAASPTCEHISNRPCCVSYIRLRYDFRFILWNMNSAVIFINIKYIMKVYYLISYRTQVLGNIMFYTKYRKNKSKYYWVL